MTAPTSLYRLFDSDDRLLYIGISLRLAGRIGQHRHAKEWWAEVARISVEHFATRREAAAAESAAITTERPAYNISGTVSRKPIHASPRQVSRPQPIGERVALLIQADGEGIPSIATICNRYEVSPRTARAVIGRLKEWGLVDACASGADRVAPSPGAGRWIAVDLDASGYW